MAYSAWSVSFGEQPSAAKWNILGTNDAHFYSFLGDNAAWQSWVPSYVNLSGGTTTYAKYTRVGDTIHFRLKYTLGGAGISGEVTFSVPVNLHADYTTASSDTILATVMLRDDNANTRQVGGVLWGSASTLVVRYISGGQVWTPLSSTAPFTWAANDVITIAGSYQCVA